MRRPKWVSARLRISLWGPLRGVPLSKKNAVINFITLSCRKTRIIRLTGARNDTIRVRVRSGAGEFISINGNAIERERAKDTWTVASQFGYIRDDLDVVDQKTSEILLRAHFHPKLGYPLSYRRTDLGGRADTGWELLEFAAPGSSSPGSSAQECVTRSFARMVIRGSCTRDGELRSLDHG